jgi:hypothetical protein
MNATVLFRVGVYADGKAKRPRSPLGPPLPLIDEVAD